MRQSLLCLLALILFCAGCGHSDPNSPARIEARREAQAALELAHQTGLEDGALDAAMELPATERRFDGDAAQQAAYLEGYLEGHAHPPTSATQTLEPGALRRSFQHGFDLGLRDGAQGLDPEPARHRGRYDARTEASFAAGYRQGFGSSDGSIMPLPMRQDRFY